MKSSLVQKFLGGAAAVAMISIATGACAEVGGTPAKPAARAAGAVQEAAASQDARFKLLLAAQLQNGQPDSPRLRTAIQDELAKRALILREARQQGLDQQPMARAESEMAAEGVFLGLYSRQWMAAHPPSDADQRSEYAQFVARMGTREVRLRQIMVAGEEDAKGVLARLAAGEKLEDLAGKVSLDRTGRANGGLVDWVPVGALSPSIAEAVAKLNAGQMAAGAVKSPAGWHVLRLEEARPYTVPGFEQVQGQIRQVLEKKAFDAHVAELQRKSGGK